MSDYNKKRTKYNLDSFVENLHEWVDHFKFEDQAGKYRVLMYQKEVSLYGTCDMVFNLFIPNELETYFQTHQKESKEDWIKFIQLYQNPKNGWFKEGLFNYAYHFKEHSTAFSVAALKLLGVQPQYDFKISKKLNSKKKVQRWLKKVPEWGLLYWPGSHRGGGVAAVYATLGEEFYPHDQFFEWYFEWLDKKADPEVGFWRLGWIHRLKKDRLTKHELGGAVHYYWIYAFLNHQIPYPEKVIDSTLRLQTSLGTWDTPYSYCIDLDAIFCLTRCCKQTKGYKKEEIKQVITKYLDYIIEKINKKDFLYQYYTSAHTLTGFVCAIAEIYKFFPELFDFKKEWIQTLDLTPWI